MKSYSQTVDAIESNSGQGRRSHLSWVASIIPNLSAFLNLIKEKDFDNNIFIYVTPNWDITSVLPL